MEHPRNLDSEELEAVLRRAHLVKAPTSLRAEGSGRLLGDLQLRGLEPGIALHLLGAKRRDQVPEAGTPVTLSILLGDEALAIHSVLLEPLVASEGDTLFPPVLRVAWPSTAVSFHHRHRVRVAAPQQAPLPAKVRLGTATHDATVLNLTETGIGLAFASELGLHPGDRVEVETVLPEAGPLRLGGEVRHISRVEDDALPSRAGIVLAGQDEETLERLRRFVQGRRTDRSESIRKGTEP